MDRGRDSAGHDNTLQPKWAEGNNNDDNDDEDDDNEYYDDDSVDCV